jgi:glycine/D-amino acid oxidase-like deaminating enzyme
VEVALQRSYDVVVIGGGVMGLMTATHLRLLGAGSVALLERRYLGAGESGKSGAILRQHYSHVQTIRMARQSLAEFAAFEAKTGRAIGFRRHGMLFLMPAAERAGLEANVRLQQQEGVQVEIVDGDALRELEPRGRFDDVIAAWEPEAGSVDPVRTVGAFGAEAIRLGVDIQLGCEVVSVLADSDGAGLRVGGVETSLGRIATRAVVAATGPWSLRLLASLGIEMPLEVVRPQQAFLRPPTDFGDDHPIVADLPNDVYFKPEGGSTRVGRIGYDEDERVDPDHYDEGTSGEFLVDARARVQNRLPAYARAVVWGGGSGLYTITPDGQAVIGPLAGLEGFWLVTGFSGHGFKLSPAVGRGVAELLVHGSSRHLDLDFFDPERFRRKLAHASGYRFKILG